MNSPRNKRVESRRASILSLAAKASLGLAPGYLLLVQSSEWQRPGPLPDWLVPGLCALVLASALSICLVKQRKLNAAAWVLVGMGWATATTLVFTRGAHSSHVGAFAPVLVSSSLLLSARGTILTTLLSLAVLVGAALLHRQGYYGPTAPLFPELTAPALSLVMTGGFIAFLMHSFSSTLLELRHKQQQLRSSQDQLRRVEKMEAIGQLAGGVAHDFNNILTGVLGHVDLLRLQAEQLPRGSELMDDINALELSAERASEITRQLLTFSRKDVSGAGVANIDRALEDADGILRRIIREDVEFRVISETPGYVGLTQTGLEQVLMNLVLNASDAMPRGGAVAITTRELVVETEVETMTGVLPPGNYARVSVADCGPGIPSESLERIFEPFFTTKAVGKGTGLGLSTALGIVQRAGGQIDVESRVAGGTTFHVFLPHALAPAQEQKRPSVAPQAPGSGVVLVCEDDPTILHVVEQVLRGAGYAVEAFLHARDAVARAEQLGDEVCLLITDVIMPHMNGPELATAIGQHIRGLPVLFISGYTAGLLADLGIDASDTRLLAKPFTARDLLQRVRASCAADCPEDGVGSTARESGRA